MKPSEIKSSIESASKKLEKFLSEYQRVKDEYQDDKVLLDTSGGCLTFYYISNVRIEDDKLKFYDSTINGEIEEILILNDWYDHPDNQPREFWYSGEVESWIKAWKRQMNAYIKFMKTYGDNGSEDCDEKWIRNNCN